MVQRFSKEEEALKYCNEILPVLVAEHTRRPMFLWLLGRGNY